MHIFSSIYLLFFFLEGPVDEDLEVDEEECPNFSVSSGEKAPLQPAPIQHLSQEISSSNSPQVSAEAQKSDNMDKTDSVSQSGSETAPQVSAEAQKLDNTDKTDSVSQSGSQTAPQVSAEAQKSDNTDNTDLVSQSDSLTASQTADTDLSSEQPQHLLDIPLKNVMWPLYSLRPLYSLLLPKLGIL